MKTPLILWVTEQGRAVAQKLKGVAGGEVKRYQTREVEKAFAERRPLIFVGACGIAVRAIAPNLRHKSLDPAVVVIDEEARFVISLLSGHLGGANALARKLAKALKATPVITTASDLRGLPALDLWLQENGAVFDDFQRLKELQVKLLREGRVKIFVEPPLKLPLPHGLEEVSTGEEADLILTYRRREKTFPVRALCLGVGFHAEEKGLFAKVEDILIRNGLSPQAIWRVATINRAGRRPLLEELASALGAEALLIEERDLKRTSPPSASRALEFLGLPGVAEPAALLAAEGGPLILPKQVYEGISLAATIHRRYT